MLREMEYRDIFDRLVVALKREYPSNQGVASSQFENRVPAILKEVIDEWKAAQGDGALALEPEYLGGRRFPDIIIKNQTDGEIIGLEVKYHDSNDSWKTPGNSVVASSMEEDVSAIFVLFGHFKNNPPEFRYDLIQNCISGIEITHKPRYMITMPDHTPLTFCEDNLGISYDELRELSVEDREVIVNTYIANTKYEELTDCDNKEIIVAQCFILFPEIFSENKKEKYKRMSVWLYANNILCRNTRDFISASGQEVVSIIGPQKLPKVFFTLYNLRQIFYRQISSMDETILRYSWFGQQSRKVIPGDGNERIKKWIQLASKEFGGATKKIDNTPYKFSVTIRKILGQE